MAGKPKYDWDSITDDMIREAYAATRSYTLAGQALGLERGGALREHLRDVRPKLKAELDAMGVKLKAVPPPEAEEEVSREEILEHEVKELRRANEILKVASAFFAQAELDRRLKN